GRIPLQMVPSNDCPVPDLLVLVETAVVPTTRVGSPRKGRLKAHGRGSGAARPIGIRAGVRGDVRRIRAGSNALDRRVPAPLDGAGPRRGPLWQPCRPDAAANPG